jgi:hypothetical protein
MFRCPSRKVDRLVVSQLFVTRRLEDIGGPPIHRKGLPCLRWMILLQRDREFWEIDPGRRKEQGPGLTWGSLVLLGGQFRHFRRCHAYYERYCYAWPVL